MGIPLLGWGRVAPRVRQWYGRAVGKWVYRWFAASFSVGISVPASADTGAVGRTVAQDAAVGFWTAGYTGAELSSDNFHCAAPEVPILTQLTCTLSIRPS